MPAQLYVDPISATSRAIAIFTRLFQLPVDVKWISIKRGEHRTPELMRANPLGKVPFLLDEGVCVPEACSILTYLSQRFQLQVPDCWYPTEIRAKTQVDAGLHWQQRTLRLNTDKVLSERVVRANRAPTASPAAPIEASEALRGLQEALSQLEHVWLANNQGVQHRPRREATQNGQAQGQGQAQAQAQGISLPRPGSPTLHAMLQAQQLARVPGGGPLGQDSGSGAAPTTATAGSGVPWRGASHDSGGGSGGGGSAAAGPAAAAAARTAGLALERAASAFLPLQATSSERRQSAGELKLAVAGPQTGREQEGDMHQARGVDTTPRPDQASVPDPAARATKDGLDVHGLKADDTVNGSSERAMITASAVSPGAGADAGELQGSGRGESPRSEVIQGVRALEWLELDQGGASPAARRKGDSASDGGGDTKPSSPVAGACAAPVAALVRVSPTVVAAASGAGGVAAAPATAGPAALAPTTAPPVGPASQHSSPGSGAGCSAFTPPSKAPMGTGLELESPAAVFTYMGGGAGPCLSDLVCACIVEQLRLLDSVQEKPDWVDILLPFPRVRAWMACIEAECRPHFGEVHANLRLSVARAHQAVMQQREAAAASLASSLTATVPLQHALAPGLLIGAAPVAAISLAAGVSVGSAARPPVPLSMPVAALLRAPSSSNLVSGGVAPVPGVPRVPMHHLQLPGDMTGPGAAAGAGLGVAPPVPSPRSLAAGVPAAAAGLPAGALLGPPAGLVGRPAVASGPTGGTAAAGLSGGGSGSGNGVACRPSFTPSFPALPQQAIGTQTPADMLRAIFNGQPPAVAAAAAAAAASSANKPATAGVRQGSSRAPSQAQGSVPRIGSSPAIVPQAGQQLRAPPRAP